MVEAGTNTCDSAESSGHKASPAAARYAINGTILAQVGNAADGLAAIGKLIFEDGTLTWDELRDAIRPTSRATSR